MNNKTISSVELTMYIINHYIYKRLTQFAQRDIDCINVFLKRLVCVTGSSYGRLCLRLYLALCLGGSSG